VSAPPLASIIIKGEIGMADYPEQHIKKLDATASKEGVEMLGLILLDMVVTVVVLYVVGYIANAIV
jgi:hypothetical protein